MKLIRTLAAVALVTSSMAASAAVFDFSNLKYSGSTNTGFLPSEVKNVGYWVCSGGDICSSNLGAGLLGGDLKYQSGAIGVTATGFYFDTGVWKQVSVVQDFENGYNPTTKIGAGLGVYHKTNDNSDDNVTTNEKLVLKFSQTVKLDALSMRSDGHNTSWVNNATFQLNGIDLKLAGNITAPTLVSSGLNVIGNEFTFQFQNKSGKIADQFYFGGLTVSAVPEPSNLMLMLLGLSAFALFARRRQSVK